MKEISTRLRGVILLIILFCSMATAQAIVGNIKIERELRELKAQKEAFTTPIRTTEKSEAAAVLRTVRKSRTTDEITRQVIETEKPETVSFIAHEEIPLAADLQEHIESECERLEVDAAYIYALIESESSFRTGLLIEDGGGHSAGLCQINSVNWPDMEKRGLDPKDEKDNITYCITLVRAYLNKYPTIDHVTTCYKAGEGGAKRLNYHLAVCDELNSRTEYYKNILKGVNNGND